MVKVSITFDDAEVRKLLRKMPPAIKIAVERFLIKAGLVVKSSAKANAPVRTARLRDSISSKVDKLRQEAVIGPNVEYGPYVEHGTRPHFPPVKALSEWAGKVLGDASLGFVIAKSISKKGTKKQPYMLPALEDNVDNIRDIFVREIDLVIKRL